jgi:methyl-accepting chemotaxis protein
MELFFEKLHGAVSAQGERLSRSRSLREALTRFDRKRTELDATLDAYIQSARTTIGQAEEKGMVLSMNPDASLREATDLIRQMFETRLPVLYRGEELRTYLTALQDTAKSFLLDNETEALDRLQQSFTEQSEIIVSRLKRLKRRLETDEILRIYETLVVQFQEVFDLALGERGLFGAHRQLLDSQAAIRKLQKDLEEVTLAFKTDIASVLDTSNELGLTVQDITKQHAGKAQLYIGIIVLIGFVAGVLEALLIIASITRPLNRLKQLVHDVEKTSDFSLRSDSSDHDEVGQTSSAFNTHMARIQAALADVNTVMASVARGDFSRSVLSRQDGDLDSLKRSVNDSIELLSQTIAGVITIGAHVDDKADALSGSAEKFRVSSRNQVESLKTMAQAMDEIESMARDNETRAAQVLEFSGRAITEVSNGNAQMNDMLLSMKKIQATGADVGNAIKVIDDIASQTHLLALNAAIEAVRVGEIGRGFAVVAQEVRNLAARSARAARESNDLILKSMEEVKKGMVNADQTASALGEIHKTVEQVNGLVTSISSSSSEQSSRIKNTNAGISRMNDTFAKDSTVVEETVAAVGELKQESGNLQKVLERFVLKTR